MYRFDDILQRASWSHISVIGDTITTDTVASLVDHTGFDLMTTSKDGQANDRAADLADLLGGVGIKVT